jgi:hypothetical protein
MFFKRFRTAFIPLALCILLIAPHAAAQIVPKPEEILGFKVGADYHLATYDQAVDYLKKAAAVSDRIRLFDMGQTSMGLTMTYAVISSPSNIAELDRYKEISRRLSLGRGLSDEEALTLSREGRAVVYIDGGLHATECAPAQHNIQLAYNLMTAADKRTLTILDDVILILVFANPDGMNLLAEWYHPNVGTPYEVSPMPGLYHIYAGHDNNRDGYIGNLVETRNISRLVNLEWHPVILYNHHQTAPFPARIWTPPNSEPTNPNVHPLIVRWQNMIGSAMGAAFDAQGKEGAISRIVFDTWYPGYMTQVFDSHNIISILTEIALYRYATPGFYTVRDFPKEYQDLTMSAFYPSPWKGGWWRLLDAVDYSLTASMAVLDTASRFRSDLLYNKYKMGRDVSERFRREPPYAWIIPRNQSDPGTAALLLDRMILQGIDIYESEEDFVCDGIRHPKGTWIIPMDQPFALFIKNIFEEQRYPDLRKYPDLWQGLVRSRKFEGAPFEAYDMMGWTLPHQFGTRVLAANSPVDVRMTRQKEILPSEGRVQGRGGAGWILDPAQNATAVAVNRLLKAGAGVQWAKTAFTREGRTHVPGTVFVSSRGLSPSIMEQTARDLRIQPTAVSSAPFEDAITLKTPRLAVYQSWIPVADEGWTRLILKEHEFDFKVIHDADIRAGNLRDAFDVIIMPSHSSADRVVHGHAPGTMPPPYVGGLTENGLINLKTFMEEGGTMIFLNAACNLAIEKFGLPLRNILSNVKSEEFHCSGAILRLEFDTSHPLAYGMTREAPAVFAGSCAFDLHPSYQPGQAPRGAAKYSGQNLLMSGYVHGGSRLHQKTAAVEVPLGKGKAVLLGFPVQYRAQPRGTFKLLFNAVFYGAASS